MRNLSAKIKKCTGKVIFVLPLLILSLFVSCEQAPTWDDPVREYFEYYTETAAICSYELLQPYLVDRDENICLTSESDKELTLYARNPKKYTLLSNWTPNEPGTGDVTVEQDPDDPTVFHFRFSQAFLANHERGGDIGGTITQKETVSQRVFEKESFKLNMRCNSAPPEITDAAVMSVTEPDNSQTYVLAFNRPGKALCQSSLPLGIHHDIASISINGVTYPVSISDDGVMSFPEDRFTTTRPESLATINRKFEHTSQSIYFLSGEPLIEGTKTYTAGFTDAAGFSTSITVDTQVPRLCAPVVKDNDGIVITAGTSKTIHTDSGTSVSTLTIEVPIMDEVDNPVDNVNLYWELCEVNQTTGEERKISPSDSETCPSTSNVYVQIPTEGWYVLRTWARKDELRDSAKMEYRLVLEYPKLKAPVVKNVDDNELSDTVNNFIELDAGHDYASVKIYRPTQTVGDENVSGTTLVYTINKGTEKSSNATVQTKNSDTTLTDAKFGQWFLSVKATKAGYSDSDEKHYLIKAFSGDIWVKAAAGGGNDETGDGSPTYPYATVQRAVSEIATYNKPSVEYTVHVSGTVNENVDLGTNLNSKAAKLTLKGESSGSLDGQSNGTVIDVTTNVPLVINGLTITNGEANGNGGGIKIGASANVTIESGTTLENNEARFGGGIYNNGTLTIEGGTIERNRAVTGGAIYTQKTFTVKASANIVPSSTNDVYLAGGNTVALADNSWSGTMTITPNDYDDTIVYLSGDYVGTHYTKIGVTPQIVDGVETAKWMTTSSGKIEKGIRCTAAEAISEIPTLASGSKIVVTGAITSDQVLDIGTEMTKRGVNDGSVGFSLDLSGTTGLTTIKAGAYNGGDSTGFYNCRSLTSLVLPLTVTTLEASAFIGCRFLTSIIGLDNVTTLGSGCFWNCYRLTTFWELGPSEVPGTFNFAKTKVTGDLSAYSNVFQGTGITSITIPNTITKLGFGFFSGCKSLGSVTFESGSQLPEIPDSLFTGCESLNSIINLPNVTKIGDYAFSGTAFSKFVVPDNVTELGYQAFGLNASLSEFVIPAGITTIGKYLFKFADGDTDFARKINVKYKGSETNWNSKTGIDSSWNKRNTTYPNAVVVTMTYDYTGD